MSDSISAIGAKAIAPPISPTPPVSVRIQPQAEKPQASAAAEAPRPKSSEGATPQAQRLVERTDGAEQNASAAAEPNGAAAQQAQQDNNIQAPEARQPLAKEDAQKAVESFMAYVDKLPGEMKFMVDADTNRQVFKIVNPVTKEVVKQFPPDEFLTMIKRLKELGTPSEDNGIFLDEKS